MLHRGILVRNEERYRLPIGAQAPAFARIEGSWRYRLRDLVCTMGDTESTGVLSSAISVVSRGHFFFALPQSTRIRGPSLTSRVYKAPNFAAYSTHPKCFRNFSRAI